MRKAPGHVLQFYHLKRRLKKLKQGARFVEFGAGNGLIANLLLEAGHSGVCFDLNESACENNRLLNKKHMSHGLLEVINEDFLKHDFDEKFDFVVSSHVIEHLEQDLVEKVFTKCKDIISEDGIIITFVPSSAKDWGVEDDIAGHKRRYSFDMIKQLSTSIDMKLRHISGLTYPLSNFLMPLGNYLIKKNEGFKSSLSDIEKTIASGNRNNRWKTDFPDYIRYLCNEFTLSPFIFLQYVFSTHQRCLCTYFELEKRH